MIETHQDMRLDPMQEGGKSMKLIYAIIRNDNEDDVISALNKEKYSVTKLASTGGLLRKGYITRVRSTEDKREYHLNVTEKYMKDYGITYDYMNVVMKRIRERFSPEEVEQLEEILDVISTELMPEVKLNRNFDALGRHPQDGGDE